MSSFPQPGYDPDGLRPQFHFTAPKGWLNDPNGLVYRDGIYHLFYQHNPFGTHWGNMTWGHAVSQDLIHWSHRPNALEPDELGTMFSGSAVVDIENTGGFGEDVIICFYTAAGDTSEASKGKPFTQCLAWSQDGESFHKWEGNPVIHHIEGGNRDPKVFWHDPSKKWIMVLYLDDDRFAILGSTDLRKWNELSHHQLSSASECPDLFPLPLDGLKETTKWVFWAANGDYQIGNFDGVAFHPETTTLKSKYGTMGYAAQTYSNVPNGRCIQINWFSGSEFPGCHWNQQMGFPNALGLRSTSEGPRLTFWPVDEVKTIRQSQICLKDGRAQSLDGLFDFEGEWTVPDKGSLSITVNGQVLVYDSETHIIQGPGAEFKVVPEHGKLDLRVLVDKTSVEVYAQKGLFYASYFILPTIADFGSFGISSVGSWPGETRLFQLLSMN